MKQVYDYIHGWHNVSIRFPEGWKQIVVPVSEDVEDDSILQQIEAIRMEYVDHEYLAPLGYLNRDDVKWDI